MTTELWRPVPLNAFVKDNLPIDKIPVNTGYEVTLDYRFRRVTAPRRKLKTSALLYIGDGAMVNADYHSFDLNTSDWTSLSNYDRYEIKMGKIRTKDTKLPAKICIRPNIGGKRNEYDLDLLVEWAFQQDRYLADRVEELKLIHPEYADHFHLVYLVPPSMRDSSSVPYSCMG